MIVKLEAPGPKIKRVMLYKFYIFMFGTGSGMVVTAAVAVELFVKFLETEGHEGFNFFVL